MILAPGDHQLIAELFEHRFLSSGQLSRLTGRSSQVIRRRLRLLASEEYVLPLERRVAEQAAYSLGPEGFHLTARKLGTEVSALPFSRRISVKKTRSPFWQHELRVSDVLIAFLLAARKQDAPAQIERVIREWEMAKPAARAHHEKFLLSERLEEHGQVRHHRPDACLLLSRAGSDPAAQVAFFLELDRGTESVTRRLRQKLEAYRIYASRARFRSLGVVGMRVLFVFDVPTERRLASLRAEIRRMASRHGPAGAQLAGMIRMARQEDLLGSDPLRSPVWTRGAKRERGVLVRLARSS